MPLTLTIRDKTPLGKETRAFQLSDLTETMTLRDLIRRRVREEVEEFNREDMEVFRGLVQPTDAEADLNGFRLRKRRKLQWEAQSEAAIHSFESNGFLVLVGDRQVDELDEPLRLGIDTDVSFIKLVPLVGG